MSFDAEVLGLAGMCQAARLTLDLARTGRCEDVPHAASIATLFRDVVDTAEEIYGDLRSLALGLSTLAGLASGRYHDPALTRMLIAVMRVERALHAHPAIADQIASGLRALAADGAPDRLPAGVLAARLADLYVATLSTLPARVIVQGHGEHLAHAETIAALRATLFAAVRSAVLWRQSGGSRLRLFVYRRRYAERARARLRELGILENNWPMPSP